jgi:hypothetical protein
MSKAHGFTFKTQDMTLVTVLRLRGFEYTGLEKVDGGCQWVFIMSDTSMQSVVDEYRNEEAWVEPREFVRKLGLVRSAMYEFLGHKPKRITTSAA